MPVRVSSTAFLRFLTAHSTTRVTKVRETKPTMEMRHDDFKRVDCWLTIREVAVHLFYGTHTDLEFGEKISRITDPKKIANCEAAAAGLRGWMRRNVFTATPVQGRVWLSSGLEVSVTPELAISWAGSSTYVVSCMLPGRKSWLPGEEPQGPGRVSKCSR